MGHAAWNGARADRFGACRAPGEGLPIDGLVRLGSASGDVILCARRGHYGYGTQDGDAVGKSRRYAAASGGRYRRTCDAPTWATDAERPGSWSDVLGRCIAARPGEQQASAAPGVGPGCLTLSGR